MTATLKVQPTPDPGSDSAALFDPSLNDWVYALRPVSALRRGTEYKLRIAPGVQPAYGNLPSTDTYEGSIRTYGDLMILPTPRPSPGSGSRFALGDPVVSFSNPLDPKSVNAAAVTISPAPAPVKDLISVPDGSNAIAIDPYALDPNATYSVTVAGSSATSLARAWAATCGWRWRRAILRREPGRRAASASFRPERQSH